MKGKISRVLAAKTSLAVRADALGDENTAEIGTANRIKVEERLRQLESSAKSSFSGPPSRSSTPGGQQKKHDFAGASKRTFNPTGDFPKAGPKRPRQ